MSECWCWFAMLAVLLVALLLTFYLFVDWLVHRSKMTAIDKWVLITGCDTGFGFETAKRLDSIGCHVIACCLTVEGCAALEKTSSSRLVPIVMNITNEESVQQAFKKISDILGPEQALWGLVNNAGVLGTLGPQEWLRQEDFSFIVEVNILGMIRVIRTFLPLLKRSPSGGRVVNMSSILGKMSVPFAAPYCMTKHAVEAFSDALRVELLPYNIHVAIIEPGGHATKLMDNIAVNTMKAWDRLSKAEQQSFGEHYLKQVLFLGTKVIPFVSSSSIGRVIDAYEHALLACCPRRRYLIGLDAFFVGMSGIIPSGLIDFVLQLPGLRAVPAECRRQSN